jgi:hypothetical protein
MKPSLSNAILLLAVIALTGCCTQTKSLQRSDTLPPQPRRYPNLLAHIQHDDLSFSVSLNPAKQSFLIIHISERDSVFKSLPTVLMRVQMTDDKVIEGPAVKPRMWYGNGGYSEMDYRFELGRSAVIDDIHSVTVTINGEKYDLCPF